METEEVLFFSSFFRSVINHEILIKPTKGLLILQGLPSNQIQRNFFKLSQGELIIRISVKKSTKRTEITRIRQIGEKHQISPSS